MPTPRAFDPIRWAKRVRPMLRTNGRVHREAHHVLLVLATYAQSDGSNARPGLTTLADESYLTERATQDALDVIQDAGLISKTGSFNGTAVWRLHLEIEPPGASLLDVRRERARAANAARQKAYRDRTRNGVGERDVTPSESVTRNAVVQRYVTHPDTVTNALVRRYVTPPSPSQTQVTPPVKAIGTASRTAKGTANARGRDAQFAAFYAAYPRHIGKAAARKAWDKAINDGVEPSVILAGAERFAVERQGQDPKYTPYPASWLNAGRWDDEPEPPRARPHRATVDDNILDFLGATGTGNGAQILELPRGNQ